MGDIVVSEWEYRGWEILHFYYSKCLLFDDSKNIALRKDKKDLKVFEFEWLILAHVLVY